jgi:hypothetical protein
MTDPVFDDADDELAFELATRIFSGEPMLFSGSPAAELAAADPSLAPAEWALFEPEAVVHAYTLRLHAGAHVAVCDPSFAPAAAENGLAPDASSATDALVRCAKRAGFRYVAFVAPVSQDACAAAAAARAAGAHLLAVPGAPPFLDLAETGWDRPVAWFENEGQCMHISRFADVRESVSIPVANPGNLQALLEESAGPSCVWPHESLRARDVAALSCHLVDMHHS